MTSEKLREMTSQAAQAKGLESCMSEEKWDILRRAMSEEMPFEPFYVVKFLVDEFPAGDMNELHSPARPCSWHEAYVFEDIFNASFAVEWVKISPRYLKQRGRLIDPEVISAEDEFRGIMEKYSIPFEEEKGVYTIFGWR